MRALVALALVPLPTLSLSSYAYPLPLTGATLYPQQILADSTGMLHILYSDTSTHRGRHVKLDPSAPTTVLYNLAIDVYPNAAVADSAGQLWVGGETNSGYEGFFHYYASVYGNQEVARVNASTGAVLGFTAGPNTGASPYTVQSQPAFVDDMSMDNEGYPWLLRTWNYRESDTTTNTLEQLSPVDGSIVASNQLSSLNAFSCMAVDKTNDALVAAGESISRVSRTGSTLNALGEWDPTVADCSGGTCTGMYFVVVVVDAAGRIFAVNYYNGDTKVYNSSLGFQYRLNGLNPTHFIPVNASAFLTANSSSNLQLRDSATGSLIEQFNVDTACLSSATSVNKGVVQVGTVYWFLGDSALCAIDISPSASNRPSASPTSEAPSSAPTTQQPSASPTHRPSKTPSRAPAHSSPSRSPSHASPSRSPSASPETHRPSTSPFTARPSLSPSRTPTRAPTTQQPTAAPSHSPLRSPTHQPSARPTHRPTSQPTSQPTTSPTAHSVAAPASTIGAAVGGAIGGLALLLAVAGAVVLARRRRRTEQYFDSYNPTYHPPV